MSFDLFGKNGLGNHGAAGAYGFLLSATPTLLVISFFLSLKTWTLPGLVSFAGIIWAGRIFALDLFRGLKVVFTGPKKQNPITENLIIILVEFGVVIAAAGLVFFSDAARAVLHNMGLWENALTFGGALYNSWFAPFAILFLVILASYTLIPANPPKTLSAIYGTFACMIPFIIIFAVFNYVLNPNRYNYIYGTLGTIITTLINIYFFFNFYFFGAQLAAIAGNFDAALFARLQDINNSTIKLEKKLFSSTDGRLNKYLRIYKPGDIILSAGDEGTDVHYILKGKAMVNAGNTVFEIDEGNFFGEMAYLLNEKRTATIVASSELKTLALPSNIFEQVLEASSSTAHLIIANLSQRLKAANG
jgi:membrane protein